MVVSGCKDGTVRFWDVLSGLMVNSIPNFNTILVRIHCIIVMIRWTGLAPWEFEFPFPGSLTSNFLVPEEVPSTAAPNARATHPSVKRLLQ